VYPHLRVRPQSSLAGFGQSALYVFRDGDALAHDDDDSWIDEPSTARVVSDASGTYVDANQAAAALFGVSCAEIIGRRAGDFTRPDARVDAGRLWELLERTGRLRSFALVSAAQGERRVEFITIKDDGGPGRNVTYLREHLVENG
jgi:PAS domain-containing protein